jgi:hypothetical protein
METGFERRRCAFAADVVLCFSTPTYEASFWCVVSLDHS